MKYYYIQKTAAQTPKMPAEKKELLYLARLSDKSRETVKVEAKDAIHKLNA